MTEKETTLVHASEIDFGPIDHELDEVAVAIDRQIERTRRNDLDALFPNFGTFLLYMFRMCASTWRAIRLLCSEREGQPKDVVLSVPPLTRTILDAVFNIVMLFDDATTNVRWYFASGWRDADKQHKRLVAKYGGDPAWADWLNGDAKNVDAFEKDAQITAPEKSDPDSHIEWWPNPGKMAGKWGQRKIKDQGRYSFLAYLGDWYYGMLSGDSHLSHLGVWGRAGYLSERKSGEQLVAEFRKFRAVAASNARLMFAVLLSELAAELALSHEQARLKNIWGHLHMISKTKWLYEVRKTFWFPEGDEA